MGTPVNFINKVVDSKQTVPTDFGTFKQEYLGATWTEEPGFTDNVDLNFPAGVNMYMSFAADINKISDVKEFGFLQQAKAINQSGKGAEENVFKKKGYKQIQDATGAFIDQDPNKRNPLYSTDKKTKAGGKRDIAGYKTEEPPIRPPSKKGDTLNGELHGRIHVGHGEFGASYKNGSAEVKKAATFADTPTNLYMDHSPFDRTQYDFETAVLAFSGNASGMYLGSVHWGFEITKAMIKVNGEDIPQGTVTGFGITKKSDGKPTSSFMDSAKAWNKAKELPGRHKSIELPLGAGKVNADNSFLFPSEKDVEGKHKLLSKDAGCMIYEKKKLGDAQAEFARVRVDQGGKIFIGWVPTASLNITQDV